MMFTIFLPADAGCKATLITFGPKKWGHVKWIVVDDGSEDDTRRVMMSFKNHSPFPIRYFFQETAGLGA